ncbi:MAG TPA: hypothetical protein VJS64_20400, partial [Pyrinomonadaceae bacterium]|nr:hypothetical protein [Pyrinomonadaceae bacterium]
PGPKDRQSITGDEPLSHLRRSFLFATDDHALTGVAVDCRPFGPVRCTSNLNPRLIIAECQVPNANCRMLIAECQLPIGVTSTAAADTVIWNPISNQQSAIPD